MGVLDAKRAALAFLDDLQSCYATKHIFAHLLHAFPVAF